MTLAVVLVLIVLHYLGWGRPVENLLMRGVSPVQSRLYNLAQGARSFQQGWVRRRDLLAENATLADQLVAYQVDRARLDSLTAENELLKQELGFINEHPTETIPAKIVTGVSDPLAQSVIINRGSRDGVRRGLGVVTANGVLVGKVSQAQDNFSTVLLLTDTRSRIAATIQNQERTAGLVEGQYGLSFSMTNIPQDREINPGDLVVTSGLEGEIPRNLLIGRVTSVNHVESNIFKTAILEPVVSLDSLSYLLVVVP